MKKRLLFTLFIFFGSIQLFATHISGGEVYWKCISGTGNYVFYLDLYSDCGNPTAIPIGVTYNLQVYNTPRPNNGTLSSIPLTYLVPEPGVILGPNAGEVIAPLCNGCSNSGQPLNCNFSTRNKGTLEKITYRSQPIVLSGKPPSNGWVFGYTSGCCRSSDIQNLSNTSASFFFKAIMYGDGRASQYPCYDNSPQFMAHVEPALCEGYDFQFNSNVVDNEFDSLSYQWANVVNSSASTTIYQPVFAPWEVGFSRTNPTPTTAQNPLNKSATLNARTGDINFNTILPTSVPANRFGIYVASIQVDSWRRNATTGQRAKVATVFRDMSFGIFRCPNIDFYYLDALNDTIRIDQKNLPPSLEVNGRKNIKSIDTTLGFGDSLVLDYRLINNGISPCGVNRVTDVYMVPMGVQFDSLYSSSNGNCMLPPCATLFPAPTGQLNRISASRTLNTQFKWAVDCSHLAPIGSNGAADKTRLFQFVFKLYDDFCPIPLVSYSSLNVTVELLKVPDAPKIYCFDRTANGIKFAYEAVSYHPDRFSKIEVYLGQRALNSTAPFVFSSSPSKTIVTYTAQDSLSNSILQSNMEYAIKLKQIDSVCGNVASSALSNLASIRYADLVLFRFNFENNVLSVLNQFVGTFQWSRNGVAIPNSNAKSIPITSSGTYRLEVTIGSCVLLSPPYTLTYVGLQEDLREYSSLIVYPNPTTKQINIGGLLDHEEIKSIRLYNLKGELVISEYGERLIDLSSLQNQLYFLRVETTLRGITKKIIKQ
jgi:hypothetical protein